jgi:hypothetical protein
VTSGSTPGVVPSAAESRPAPAATAWCEGDELYVELVDGRVVRHPLPDFVRRAAIEKRRCEVEEFGTAIWWPELDEGIGVNAIFGVSEDVIDQLAGFTKGMPTQ